MECDNCSNAATVKCFDCSGNFCADHSYECNMEGHHTCSSCGSSIDGIIHCDHHYREEREHAIDSFEDEWIDEHVKSLG